MERVIWVSYNELFGNSEVKTLDSLLSNIPSTAIFQRIAFINSKTHLYEREQLNQVELFNDWIKHINPCDKKELLKRIADFISKLGVKKIMFFTNISSMTLAHKALELLNDDQREELTPEEEYKCLLAYFRANDFLDEKQSAIINPLKLKKCWSKVDQFLHTHLLLLIAQVELIDHKNFTIQIVKGVRFFKYIEGNKSFNAYLNDFIANLGFESWKEYFIKIADIYANLLKNDSENTAIRHGIIINPPTVAIIDLLDSMSINFGFNQEKFKSLNAGQIFDYKIFREKPLFKVNSNEYCFLNLNFFIDKFFDSLNFQFYNFISTKKNYKITYQGFKGQLSLELSEQTLFFETMEAAFSNFDKIKVKGSEYDLEYSDYYFRSDNQIFLFEFKDYILNAEKKHSYDFDCVSTELKTKYINENGAIQLIKVIKKIENGKIIFDTGINFHRLNTYSVFPILVFTDYTLNSTGINYLLNQEFVKLKAKERFVMKVKDLIIIDLNTIIEIQELLINGTFNLLELCQEYLDFVNSANFTKKPLQELTSFSEYINLQVVKLRIDRIPPKSFETSLKEIFNEN